MYIIFALFLAFLVACDSAGDGDGGSTVGSGGAVLDDPLTGESPGGNPAPPAPNPGPPGALNGFQAFMLGVINDARAQSRNCGAQFFPAAPPVTWDERVQAAAQEHSDDMAANQFFNHIGSDGSNPGDRLLMENYDWFTWGENILFGAQEGDDAVDELLKSASHCSSIMSPDFQEVGAGSAQGSLQGFSSAFWTILFATEGS